MLILGIETSCDETAAALVENGTKVISSSLATSSDMHAKTGGIIPEDAARQQIKSIIPVISDTLTSAMGKPEASTKEQNEWAKKHIDAIAVTYGPGLIGSLLVGVETAKTLSEIWKKPLIPVNHLVAHMYACFVEQDPIPAFPALALVVSGGHTDLVSLGDHSDITWIGGTRDDAAGEAFDKTARLLGLPYPGGPAISKAAGEILKEALTLFPRPMIDSDDFDFSFSGLKTAVHNHLVDTSDKNVPKLAAEVQEAIVDSLVAKVSRALTHYDPKSFLLSGGVAANTRLKVKLSQELTNTHPDIKYYLPEPKYCTDNAVVIASCAYFNNKPVSWEEVNANPELTITHI